MFKLLLSLLLAAALVVELHTLWLLNWAPEHVFYTTSRWILIGIICRTILWMGDKKKKG